LFSNDEALVRKVIDKLLIACDKQQQSDFIEVVFDDSNIPEIHVEEGVKNVMLFFGIYNLTEINYVNTYRLVISNGALEISNNDETLLAGLISHELAHIMLGHIAKLKEIVMEGSTDESLTRKTCELEADKYALFILANAGYPITALRKVLEILSNRIGIWAQSKYVLTHPPTSERIAMLQTVESEIKLYSEQFTNGAKIIKNNPTEENIENYIKILQKLQSYFPKSPQIYNNLGLCYFYKYLLFADEVKFVISSVPELEFEAQKGIKVTLRSPKIVKQKEELLNLARDYLTRAIQLDPGYRNALINLCCVEFESKNYDNLKKISSALFKIDKNSLESRNLAAIINYLDGKKTLAKTQFNDLIKEEHSSAYYNLFSIYCEEGNIKGAKDILENYVKHFGKDNYYLLMETKIKKFSSHWRDR
jgi:predicted Zn-dependent protease